MSIIDTARSCFLAVLLVGCASKMEPAQQRIDQIAATVSTVSAFAAKYVPDQLKDVQSKLDHLRVAFAMKDYSAVIDAAPAVMSAAEALAPAATAKKNEAALKLGDEWSTLAAFVPDAMAKIQSRVGALHQKSAPAELMEAMSIWSKAQAAFAAGNMAEAVSSAKAAESKVRIAAARTP